MINVKVVCQSGAVLICSRAKASEVWTFRQPGLMPIPIVKSKTNEDILAILSAIAEDFGGVKTREVFKENSVDTRVLKGGLEP